MGGGWVAATQIGNILTRLGPSSPIGGDPRGADAAAHGTRSSAAPILRLFVAGTSAHSGHSGKLCRPGRGFPRRARPEQRGKYGNGDGRAGHHVHRPGVLAAQPQLSDNPSDRCPRVSAVGVPGGADRNGSHGSYHRDQLPRTVVVASVAGRGCCSRAAGELRSDWAHGPARFRGPCAAHPDGIARGRGRSSHVGGPAVARW